MLLYGDISLRAVQREENMVQQHPTGCNTPMQVLEGHATSRT